VHKEHVKKPHIAKRDKEISKLENLINKKETIDMTDIRNFQTSENRREEKKLKSSKNKLLKQNILD